MRLHFLVGVVTLNLLGITSHASAQMFIFPEKGQTKEQQEFDEFTCNKWAKEQTGFDPNQAVASPPPQAPHGGQALGGAAVGGGMGMMRSRRAEMGYQQQVQAQTADRQANQAKFNRAYSVCLDAKGYKVG